MAQPPHLFLRCSGRERPGQCRQGGLLGQRGWEEVPPSATWGQTHIRGTRFIALVDASVFFSCSGGRGREEESEAERRARFLSLKRGRGGIQGGGGSAYDTPFLYMSHETS